MEAQIDSEKTPRNLSKDAPSDSTEFTKKKNTNRFISTVIILGISAVILGVCGWFYLFMGGCLFERHSWAHPPVDARPILDISLPEDMDLSQWEKQPTSADWRGVWIDIMYFQTIEEADQKFMRSNGYTYISGESPNRYRLSDVKETTDEFCNGYGSYNSEILIQKGKHLIRIEERYAENKDSREIEKTIAKLAGDWNESIQSGRYRKISPGRFIFAEKCEFCHSINSFTHPQDRYISDTGPNLYSLYESEEELEDGSCIRVDENYLRQSILTPSNQVVLWWGTGGYDTRMKSIALSEDDVEQLVQYLTSLADREFQCRERPAVTQEDNIVGVWQNYQRRSGSLLTIKNNDKGGYTIFDGSKVEGEFRYDSNKGIYIGRINSNDQWREWGSLTVELRDSNTMLLTHFYESFSPVWLFVRQFD